MYKPIKNHALVICLLVAGTASSSGLALYLYKANRRISEMRFNNETSQIKHFVEARLETYLNALMHTKAFFVVNRDFDAKKFGIYVENLDLLDKYPGILGIGWKPRVKADEL